jgi:hypothetical protein
MKICKGMYGLPQAGMLANKLLQKRLATHIYSPCKHTHGLWRHATRPIVFSLNVDDFGVKYVGKENADHLYHALCQYYPTSIDWPGGLYCGIMLHWDYDARTVDLSMPGYVAAALQTFQHSKPARHHYAPSRFIPPNYGATTQFIKVDDTDPMTPDQTLRLQQVIGTFLYYARAVLDSTMLHALTTLASEQSVGTQNTVNGMVDFLNYCASNPNAILRYTSSDMVLHTHSDAAYLTDRNARIRAGGHHYMGNNMTHPNPIHNGSILDISKILRMVVVSAAEAEVGALFYNCQDAAGLRTIAIEMGHPSVRTDNSTANGIINDTVKQN